MRTVIIILTFSAIPLFAVPGLSTQQIDGCPDIQKAARNYITINFPTDEEKPVLVEHKIIHLIPKVSAVQLFVPEADEDKNSRLIPYLLFFAGQSKCDLVFQTDGEFFETLAAGSTKFIFVKTTDNHGGEQHIDFQVITARANGEVTPTRDQHGSEIYFSQLLQTRCEGTVGDVTYWKRNETDSQRIIIQQRRTDRDTKCRITEDASTYRYYRLTPQYWELEDDETDEEVAEKRH